MNNKSQTFGLGLLITGVLFAYTGIRNVTIAQAIQGKSESNPSSAGRLAGIALQGSDTPAPESSPSPNAGKLPVGVVNWTNPEGNKVPVAAWIYPLLKAAKATGKWAGHVNSGWRSKAEQAAIYNSGQRPAAKPGTSNHEGTVFPRGAVDVRDASGLARALKSVPGGSALVWAGSKDPVHFSHPHNGSY